ncbi:MAG: thioesterase family protein [Candidatus Bathyarchaeia archaeon]
MSARSFKTSIRVTWADTDAAQVVHFSNYFRFFERAEEEFYRALGFSFTDFRSRGLWFPRVEAFCQYKKPAGFNDMLDVEVTVEELREKSVRLGFTVSNKETEDLLASGYLVIVAADRRTRRATQMPAEAFEKLKPYAKQVL